jgi:hypothetical protein
MKIRTGFVSNSSSSSFIIGLAKVPNEEKLGFTFYPSEIHYCDCSKKNYILGEDGVEIEVELINDDTYRLTLESFDYRTVSCIVSPGDKVFYFFEEGDEGDYFFLNCIGDLDYSKVDLSFFEEDDIKKYELVQELGGEAIFGAGRNG